VFDIANYAFLHVSGELWIILLSSLSMT